jgi:DNA polymerase III subunit epsilon
VLKFFSAQWDSVPVVLIDTETTGIQPGRDRTVQVGIVRFEGGEIMGSRSSFIDPGIPIPEAATAIHGITDIAVQGAPSLADFFADPETRRLLDGAQPAAYNASFDRHFVPPFGDDWTWPWLDSLSLVRKVDRYAKGAGRHKLEATCKRHGVPLEGAHDAIADATAAGLLLYKLGRATFPQQYSLGQALGWQRRVEAEEWFRFNEWLSAQPTREGAAL